MRAVVVGAGIVGLSTALALVDAGVETVCVDAGEPMGARSAGATRIFRLAHADPALVDDARAARRIWAAWSRRAGTPLVGTEGTVVSGSRVPTWAAAMADADAEHRVDDPPSALPITPTGPVLHDPSGGVLDLAATGRFLRGAVPVRTATVSAIGAEGVVHLDGEPIGADAVVVAAGAGTAALARPLGVDVPTTREHHARFTFRHRRAGDAAERSSTVEAVTAPCLLDGETHGPLSRTYQHRTGDGYWAIGGHPPDADTAWELGVDEVTRRSRAAVSGLVAERAPDLDPEPVETLTCDPTPGLGDGVFTAVTGVVHVVWGDNLAKLAPLIGERLRDAATGRTAG